MQDMLVYLWFLRWFLFLFIESTNDGQIPVLLILLLKMQGYSISCVPDVWYSSPGSGDPVSSLLWKIWFPITIGICGCFIPAGQSAPGNSYFIQYGRMYAAQSLMARLEPSWMDMQRLPMWHSLECRRKSTLIFSGIAVPCIYTSMEWIWQWYPSGSAMQIPLRH